MIEEVARRKLRCKQDTVLYAADEESEMYNTDLNRAFNQPNRILAAKNTALRNYLDSLDKALKDAQF